MLLSRDLTDIVKGLAKAYFFPLLEYRRRYSCVVFSVGKLSYYPTSIINGKCEFYFFKVVGCCLAVFQLLAENANGQEFLLVDSFRFNFVDEESSDIYEGYSL